MFRQSIIESITMLQIFYMFRLHIVCGVVEFVRMAIESTGCREFATGESNHEKVADDRFVVVPEHWMRTGVVTVFIPRSFLRQW